MLNCSTLNLGNPTTLKTTDYKISKREHRDLIYISKVTSQYMESAQVVKVYSAEEIVVCKNKRNIWQFNSH